MPHPRRSGGRVTRMRSGVPIPGPETFADQDDEVMSAADHVDRIEGMVYNALYGDRRAPDPTIAPAPPRSGRTRGNSVADLIDGH
jgi:hypothetical protein